MFPYPARRPTPGLGFAGEAGISRLSAPLRSRLQQELRRRTNAGERHSALASCGDLGKNSQRQNLLDHARRFASAIHSVVREFIGWQTLFVQAAETRFVAKQRPVGNLRAAFQQVPQSDSEARSARRPAPAAAPDFAAARSSHRRAKRCAVSASARYSATMRASCSLSSPAEFGFARASKNLGNREAGSLRDAAIEVGVQPSELAGQQARGGGFTAAHESGQADQPSRANFVGHRFG